MKVSSAIKILQRAGFVVTDSGPRERDGQPLPPAEYIGRRPGSRCYVEFSRNGGDSDEVVALRAMRDNWQDDLQADYFAGCWQETMKGAIRMVEDWEASSLAETPARPALTHETELASLEGTRVNLIDPHGDTICIGDLSGHAALSGEHYWRVCDSSGSDGTDFGLLDVADIEGDVIELRHA